MIDFVIIGGLDGGVYNNNDVYQNSCGDSPGLPVGMYGSYAYCVYQNGRPVYDEFGIMRSYGLTLRRTTTLATLRTTFIQMVIPTAAICMYTIPAGIHIQVIPKLYIIYMK